MTETPIEEATVEDEPHGPQEAHCRHCGQPSEVDVEVTPDWLCAGCGRYQDAMTCPTCGSIVRISLMPEGSAPEVHAPIRSRKTKGDE